MKLLITTMLVALMATTGYSKEPVAKKSQNVAQHLQEISVTIRANRSEGSGVLFSRKIDGEEVTFVWTAAHVIKGLKESREVVDSKTGTKRSIVAFKDAQILKELVQDGRRVGETVMEAEVIKYSDADNGHDLAILMVRKRGFAVESAAFYLDKSIPSIGTQLFHVGSLQGQMGANSMTTGIVSQIGRVLTGINSKVVFDQTTATAFPGSSGGGVYLTDGRYVGMLVRGAGEGFNFIVPVRRLKKWADDKGIGWLVDPKVPAPTMEELRKINIDDVDFSKGSEKDADDDGADPMTRFLIRDLDKVAKQNTPEWKPLIFK